MTSLALTGGHLITPTEHRFTNLWLDGPRVAALSETCPDGSSQCRQLDVSDCYVTPGLVDLQVNGGPECDLWADPQPGEIGALRARLAGCGVTSFLPTLITDEPGHMRQNMDRLRQAGTGRPAGNDVGTDGGGSRMLGIHLEGPCLSPERPGVHPSRFIVKPSPAFMRDLVCDEVALVTMAPELDEGLETVDYLVKAGICVALGHSNATYAQASEAFSHGVRLVTHAFNALPPVLHRAPGAIGAALADGNVSLSVIADGLHVDPFMVGLLVRHKGVDGVVLVSDSARVGTSQGGLVGSSITVYDAVRNVVAWGLASFPEAVRMASFNPCRLIGLEGMLGVLAPGALADIAVWEKATLRIRHVIIGGRLVAGTPE